MNCPPKCRVWRALFGFAVALVLGLAGGALGTAGAATPTASPGATPSAGITLDDLDPAGLRDALLTTQPPTGILPDGPDPLRVYPWDDASDDDLAGTLGGAIIATEDPFGSALSPAISDIVFPDEAGAIGRYAAIAEITDDDGATITPVDPVEVGGVPASIVAFEEQTLCVAQVDYVLVIASIAPTADPSADAEAVAGLANAGIEYLVELAEGMG